MHCSHEGNFNLSGSPPGLQGHFYVIFMYMGENKDLSVCHIATYSYILPSTPGTKKLLIL